MDPNKTLELIRGLASSILIHDSFSESMASDLAEAVDDLDKWLSKGGFKPEAWK